MKAKELIQGRIYYFKTGYEWIVRFDKLEHKCIIGFGALQDGRYRESSYSNSIGIHKEIREATAEEIELYERLETNKLVINETINSDNLLIFN